VGGIPIVTGRDVVRAPTERLLRSLVVARGNCCEQAERARISSAAERPPCEPVEVRAARVNAYAASALSNYLPLYTNVSR
jgi:hypothetical protein